MKEALVGKAGPFSVFVRDGVGMRQLPDGSLSTQLTGKLAKGTAIRFTWSTVSSLSPDMSLDEAVELARLLVRAAATNGWGSDTERQRLIAWAPIGRSDG